MKLYMLLSIALLCGCVTKYQPIALHDGMYGDYNSEVAEECAKVVIGMTDNPDLQAKLFNRCVFDQGITI